MACREQGVRIPDDVSITGVDNTDLGATQTPGADQHPHADRRDRPGRGRAGDRAPRRPSLRGVPDAAVRARAARQHRAAGGGRPLARVGAPRRAMGLVRRLVLGALRALPRARRAAPSPRRLDRRAAIARALRAAERRCRPACWFSASTSPIGCTRPSTSSSASRRAPAWSSSNAGWRSAKHGRAGRSPRRGHRAGRELRRSRSSRWSTSCCGRATSTASTSSSSATTTSTCRTAFCRR